MRKSASPSAALSASRYLRPVLDDEALVTGRLEPGIEYLSCRRPGSIDGFSPSPAREGSVSIVIAAFELSGAASDSDHIDEIQRQCGRIAGREGRPDAIVVAADAEFARPIIGLVADRSRDGLVFHVVCDAGSEEHSGVSETYPLPARIRSSWSARSVPKDPFFDGLVSNVLQLISYRRKAIEG